MRGRRTAWADEEFVAAVAKRTTSTDVLRELGVRPATYHLRLSARPRGRALRGATMRPRLPPHLN